MRWNPIIRFSVTVDALTRSLSKYLIVFWVFYLVSLLGNNIFERRWVFGFLVSQVAAAVWIELIELEVDRFRIWTWKIQKLYRDMIPFHEGMAENAENVELFNANLFYGRLSELTVGDENFLSWPLLRWAAYMAGLVTCYGLPEKQAEFIDLYYMCRWTLTILASVEFAHLLIKWAYCDLWVGVPAIEFNYILGKQYYHVNKTCFIQAPFNFDARKVGKHAMQHLRTHPHNDKKEK